MQTAAVHAFSCQAAPADWPIQGPCLAALKDLGLSDGQVARYFGVKLDEVAVLRTSYGIAEAARPVRAEPRKRRLFSRRRA